MQEIRCPGNERNYPNGSAFITKAIRACSSKMGKEIRHPKDTSIIDVFLLIFVVAQQVFEYIPVC